MSMTIAEDRFGQILTLKTEGNHGWRRGLGLYFLSGITLCWAVVAILLVIDAEIGWITKVILFAAASLIARLLVFFVETLLTPRSGAVELQIDQPASEIRLTRHSVFRKPRPIVVDTHRLSSLRLAATGMPSISLSNLFAAARASSGQGPVDGASLAQQHLRTTPLELELSIDYETSEGRSDRQVFKLGVDGVSSASQAVVLGFRMAAASDLGYQQVYVVPRVGVEIHLRPESGPDLEPVPDNDAGLETVAEQALGKANTPPFDPQNLLADHVVTTWSPGHQVVFEKNPSRARFLALPFALLALVGPALLFYAQVHEKEINPVGFVVLSGLGLLVGCLAILIVRLPKRRVEFDWPRQTLTITRRPKATTWPLHDLRRLEIEGIVSRSSSGDSGSTSTSYRCEVKVVSVGSTDRGGKPIELLSTRSSPRAEEPWRQASPLAEDLAEALGLDYKTLGYGREESGPRELLETHWEPSAQTRSDP